MCWGCREQEVRSVRDAHHPQRRRRANHGFQIWGKSGVGGSCENWIGRCRARRVEWAALLRRGVACGPGCQKTVWEGRFKGGEKAAPGGGLKSGRNACGRPCRRAAEKGERGASSSAARRLAPRRAAAERLGSTGVKRGRGQPARAGLAGWRVPDASNWVPCAQHVQPGPVTATPPEHFTRRWRTSRLTCRRRA